MEIFSHNYATAYGRTHAVTDEEYLQNSLEPSDRLTTRELNQLRAIREEIESRPRITRYEKRYIRVLKATEEKLGEVRSNSIKKISHIRHQMKEVERTSTAEKRSIAIACLIAAIARQVSSQFPTYSKF